MVRWAAVIDNVEQMHVRMRVAHTTCPDSLARELANELGQTDDQVFDRSTVFGVPAARDVLRPQLTFASERDTYRLIILRSSNSDLDVIIEETPHARLTFDAQAVWDLMRKALKSFHPVLRSSTVNADLRDVAFLTGRYGVRSHLWRDAIVLPAASLALSLMFVLAASRTFATTTWPAMLLGAVGLTVSVVWLGGKAIGPAVRQKISWEVAPDVNGQ
jgi:hypothetical protein